MLGTELGEAVGSRLGTEVGEKLGPVLWKLFELLEGVPLGV